MKDSVAILKDISPLRRVAALMLVRTLSLPEQSRLPSPCVY